MPAAKPSLPKWVVSIEGCVVFTCAYHPLCIGYADNTVWFWWSLLIGNYIDIIDIMYLNVFNITIIIIYIYIYTPLRLSYLWESQQPTAIRGPKSVAEDDPRITVAMAPTSLMVDPADPWFLARWTPPVVSARILAAFFWLGQVGFGRIGIESERYHDEMIQTHPHVRRSRKGLCRSRWV